MCCYCQHFPGDGKTCPCRPDVDLQGGKAFVECDFRISTLTTGRDVAGAPIGSTMWASVLVCAVFGLIVALTSMFNTSSRPSQSGIALFAHMPSEVPLGKKVAVTFSIHCPQGALPESLSLRIPKEFLSDKFEFVEMNPPVESHRITSSGHHYFDFRFDPGAKQLEVQMWVRAARAGSCQLSAKVLTGDYLTHAPAYNPQFSFGEVKTIGVSAQQPATRKPVGQMFQPLPVSVFNPM
jgi:hypothetical protein